MILDVQGLRVATGPMIRLDGLDLALEAGGCIALLGPNGAGKTASVEAIAGLIPKAMGRVLFDGQDISALPASAVVRRGLTLVPQWRELFPGFSVEETLLAGANAARARSPLPTHDIYDLFPRLAERRQQLAGSLSGGEQQMLAIGRALISNPKLMLLDEPSAGLAVGIVRSFISVVKRIRAGGVAILLVEQNLEIASALADSCIVLAAGRVVCAGLPVTRPPARKSAKPISHDCQRRGRTNECGTERGYERRGWPIVCGAWPRPVRARRNYQHGERSHYCGEGDRRCHVRRQGKASGRVAGACKSARPRPRHAPHCSGRPRPGV